MVFVFALWFIYYVAISASPMSLRDRNLDDWPYVFKDNGLPKQSPVDISTKYAQRRYLPFLRYSGYWSFDKAVVNITNTGHTVQVKLVNNSEDIPFLTGGPLFDSKYEFEQMHFHWGKHDFGSEHKVNGHQYAMEVHMVHYKKEYGTFENAQKYYDGLCVVGFFGEISSKNNRDMENFITDLRHLIQPNSKITRNFKEEFSWMKKTALKQHYYTYPGSLTTSPFTECVIWIIFTKPIKISRKQLMEFRKLHSSHKGVLINENDRELQSFNNRTILYGY